MRPHLKLSYFIIAVLILAGAAPLFLYGTRVISLNRDALRTKEREYQTASTRALADEIGLYYRQGGVAAEHLGDAITVLASGDLSGDKVNSPDIRGLLAESLHASPHLLYLAVINDQAQEVSASRLPNMDVFLLRAIERAYLVARAGQTSYVPVEVSLEGNKRVVMLRSLPLWADPQATPGSAAAGPAIGVLLQVEGFSLIQQRLDEMTAGGMELYVVDDRGRLIAAGAQPGHFSGVLGQDLSHLEIVRRFLSWHGNPLASETASYQQGTDDGTEAMLGTYSAISALHWAVIAQRPERLAFASARELEREGYMLMIASLIVSVVLGVYFSSRLTHPLELLSQQARALARREFLGRIELNDQTEIGDLARSFNAMAEEVEHYVNDLKVAAEKNHELFLGSIRLLAQAVDQKDPYTRGHSDRVTKYSVAIAKRLGLTEAEVEQVRIAAQLHDVGKIGIDDRILKKPGALSNEEFVLMKQHTVKGANIVRQVEQLHDVLPGIELHHEAVNGTGYPYGLRDEQIPTMAKIISVADTFDAMTTERPYQAAHDTEQVVAIIQQHAGVRYSPAVVEAFVEAVAAGEIRPQRTAAAVAAL
ncbi:MAG: HD domain-containing phosphohydrolase [Terriglobales bacterium]